MAKILIVKGKNGRGPQKEFEVPDIEGPDGATRLNVQALADWIDREQITELRFAIGSIVKGKGQIFTRAVPIKPLLDLEELTRTVQMLEGM